MVQYKVAQPRGFWRHWPTDDVLIEARKRGMDFSTSHKSNDRRQKEPLCSNCMTNTANSIIIISKTSSNNNQVIIKNKQQKMGKAPSIHAPVDHRAKLLHRLGFSQPESPRTKHVLKAGARNGTTSIIGNTVPIREPLNDGTPKRTRVHFFNSKTNDVKRTRIQFNNDVMVIQIPSHNDYSNRIREYLWSSGHEISENAERNRIEYASEGWDWHSVLEDDDMYVDARTGELVHPVWIDEDAMDVADEASSEPNILEAETPALSRSDSFAIGLDELSE